jgi:hypothetical protein
LKIRLRNRTVKTRIFGTLPVVRDCQPGDNLLSLYIIYVWVVTPLPPNWTQMVDLTIYYATGDDIGIPELTNTIEVVKIKLQIVHFHMQRAKYSSNF